MIPDIFTLFGKNRALPIGMAGVLLMALLTVSGCTSDSGEEARSRLYGTWKTYAGEYNQAHQARFEISQEEIVFRTVEGTLNINYISSMDYTPSQEGAEFHIVYRNSDGDEFVLDLILMTTRRGDILKFKNQRHVSWKKIKTPPGLR